MASEEKKKKNPTESASGELAAEDLDKVTGGAMGRGDNDDATGRGDNDDGAKTGGVITFGKE